MSEQTQRPTEPDGALVSDTPAEPSKPAAYPFSVLHVLSTALRITRHNFVPFFVLACVLALPGFVLNLMGGTANLFLGFVINLVTNALTVAVLAYGVIMELHGSRPSTRACIASGVGQIVPVLGVTLVSTIVIGGATLFLVIPGIIVALMFYVVVPVTIIERVGIDAAMKRSRQLTHGRKGDLFLIVLLSIAVSVAIELVAQYELGHNAAIAWRALGSALVTMVFAVTTAVVYVELRKLRDGTQVPELATAFARIRSK
jgi:hypothetical protein